MHVYQLIKHRKKKKLIGLTGRPIRPGSQADRSQARHPGWPTATLGECTRDKPNIVLVYFTNLFADMYGVHLLLPCLSDACLYVQQLNS